MLELLRNYCSVASWALLFYVFNLRHRSSTYIACEEPGHLNAILSVSTIQGLVGFCEAAFVDRCDVDANTIVTLIVRNFINIFWHSIST